MSNYRPISLLTSFSKFFERVIHKQVFDYLNTNCLLSPSQFGFRPGHSTELASLSLSEYNNKLMDDNKLPINIYIY